MSFDNWTIKPTLGQRVVFSGSTLILQKQKAVIASLKNEQLLHFGFAEHSSTLNRHTCSPNVTETEGFSRRLCPYKTCTTSLDADI